MTVDAARLRLRAHGEALANSSARWRYRNEFLPTHGQVCEAFGWPYHVVDAWASGMSVPADPAAFEVLFALVFPAQP